MFDLAFLLAPVLVFFFLGILLRKSSVLDEHASGVLLKLFYHLTLPALLLSVMPYVVMNASFFFLPLIAASIILLTLAASIITGKALRMENRSLALFLTGSVIMNLGFVMPFVQAFYGDDGLARLFVFDIPNGLSASALAFFFAKREGGPGKRNPVKLIITSPPLLALLAGILMNAFSLRPAPIAIAVLHSIGGLTIPLILLGLGASFSMAKINPLHLAALMALRMALGLALGLWLAGLFRLEGIDRAVVVLSASAPAGFTTLIFGTPEKPDGEFASTLAASGMITAMLLIPVLLTIL